MKQVVIENQILTEHSRQFKFSNGGTTNEVAILI